MILTFEQSLLLFLSLEKVHNLLIGLLQHFLLFKQLLELVRGDHSFYGSRCSMAASRCPTCCGWSPCVLLTAVRYKDSFWVPGGRSIGESWPPRPRWMTHHDLSGRVNQLILYIGSRQVCVTISARFPAKIVKEPANTAGKMIMVVVIYNYWDLTYRSRCSLYTCTQERQKLYTKMVSTTTLKEL